MKNETQFKGHIVSHVQAQTAEHKAFQRIDILSMSIIATRLALFYNERLKSFNSSYYKHNLKRYANLLLPELIKAEKAEFNKLLDAGETIITSQTDEVQDAIELILQQGGFAAFKLTNKFNKAFNYDSEKLMAVIDEILEKHEPARRNSE